MIGTTVASSASMLELSLETQQDTLQKAIDGSAATLEERLRNSAGDIAVKIGEAAREIGGATDALSARIETSIGNVTTRLDETGARIETSLDTLQTRVGGDLANVNSSIEDAGRRFADALEDKTAVFARTSDEAAERITGILDEQTTRVADTLESRTSRLAETFDSGTARIDERLGTMDRALTIGLENVNRTIEGKASDLAVSLRGAVTSATQSIGDEAARSSALLSKSGSNLQNRCRRRTKPSPRPSKSAPARSLTASRMRRPVSPARPPPWPRPSPRQATLSSTRLPRLKPSSALRSVSFPKR